MGISVLVSFRDWSVGTDDRRVACACKDTALGLDARLHRDVGSARDGDAPRGIRARRGTAYRSGAFDTRRPDRVAEAAFHLGVARVEWDVEKKSDP